MKKMVIILTAIGLIACKSSSTATTTKDKTETTTSNPDEMVFDVIVKFISKGEGIARDLKTTFEEAVAKFNKDNHTNIEADIRHWGREGEVDLNYNLKNLSTKQKNAFISMVKETVGHTDMVQIKLNATTVQKR